MAGSPSRRWRGARWLAGAWLLQHLLIADAADTARSGHAGRANLVRRGLSPSLAQFTSHFKSPEFLLDALMPGTIELSNLRGAHGFRSNGISSYDVSGIAVSGAGDVNGDGLGDILIGAFGADPNGTSSGQSYVVYGGSAIPGAAELSALNGTNGFRINGIGANDGSGRAVSDAGDVNRDGFDDILIGAFTAQPHGYSSGQTYVVYGGSAIPGTVEASDLDGTNGFVVNGIATIDRSGYSVSDAGDVNGDHFDDILIGASFASPHGGYSGQSYVVYGKSAVPGTVELSALNGTNGFRVNGISTNDYSGSAVGGAGDVNHDGFDDILIGAPSADPHDSGSGQSYIVYGRSAVPATVELSGLNGTNGLRLNGIATYDNAGVAVGGAGDVNHDGFADILIGAPWVYPHASKAERTYVVYGKSTLPGTIELSALNGTNGFRLNGISAFDYAGRAVSGAGDVNGDGFADILVGAGGADPHGSYSGQSYLVYGGSALPSALALSALNGINGIRFNGISTLDLSGFSVSGAGDVNGAGMDDLVIGALGANPNGENSGQTYVVYSDGVARRGDCNADNVVDGADVAGIVLEIFDGDGTSPAAAFGGSFYGDPIGCNANADAKVDAGDLACVARIIFGRGGGCGP